MGKYRYRIDIFGVGSRDTHVSLTEEQQRFWEDDGYLWEYGNDPHSSQFSDYPEGAKFLNRCSDFRDKAFFFQSGVEYKGAELMIDGPDGELYSGSLSQFCKKYNVAVKKNKGSMKRPRKHSAIFYSVEKVAAVYEEIVTNEPFNPAKFKITVEQSQNPKFGKNNYILTGASYDGTKFYIDTDGRCVDEGVHI